jgi:hypothetical protein
LDPEPADLLVGFSFKNIILRVDMRLKGMQLILGAGINMANSAKIYQFLGEISR